MKAAWQVGALVVIFVALLFGAMNVLQTSIFSKPKEQYFARFVDAGGLQTGSQVQIAGVKVGMVSQVTLEETGTALVTMELEAGTKVPRGSKAILPSSFISIGDRIITISLPTDRSQLLQANSKSDAMPGTLQSALEGIMPDSQQTLTELNKTLVAFQELLRDQELKTGVVNLMDSGTQTAQSFGRLADNAGRLTARMDRLLASNEKRFESMLISTSGSLQNMKEVSDKLRDFAVNGKLDEKAVALMDELTGSVKAGRTMVEDIQKLTGDPQMQEAIKKTTINFATMSESGTKIAADAEKMAANGVEISAQTKDLMTKANKLADEVDKLIQDFKKTLSNVDLPGLGGKSLIPDIGFEANIARQTDLARFRVDANVYFPTGKEKLIFGLYDAFESNKLNLMFQRPVGQKMDLRYGVYASQPGIGVDFRVAPSLMLRGDLFGLNEPQLDLRLRYDFSGGISGFLGADRIFQRPTPSVGVGIRR
jgi:phospholipid/cholesterol/gamma-HCH transport system substrate-binding protein